MSKLRADITYSHRLNSNITSDFTISDTNINITDISNLMEKSNEIPVEKNNEILIEEDSDDNETDQINIENEFGDVLAVLLGTIIIISSIWLVTGIRQYRLIGSWNKRYGEYIREKQEMDRKIASQYGSGEDTSSSSDC